MSIKIRKAKLSDIPVVMDLLRKTDFLTENSLYDTPEYFERSVSEGIFFVAEMKNVGVIGLIHGEKLMCDGSVIWYFVVDEQYRSQGIGKILISAFENECKNQNIKWIFGSSDINKKTMGFYKKNKYSFAGKYIEFTKNL